MRTLLVVLFVTFISLPLAANLAGVDGADPGAENRELATLKTDGAVAWFNDHFGFRSTLVRWYGVSRLRIGVSPSATVIKGRDGWFFYADDDGAEDYANVEPLSAVGIANWRASILRAKRWLDARHVAYVFTIAPDKHAIYDEDMPDTIARINAMSRADQLYSALQDMGLAVDTRPALFEAKARERIYQQTDTHWNERGAFAAYQQIINAVRARVPATPPAWTRADFRPEERDVAAMDLAGMMGLKRVLREVDLRLVPIRQRRARVVEPAGARPTDQEGRLVTEIADPTLPRAVIFRDSFVSQLVPFLSEHFSRAVYVWQNDFDWHLVDDERADVVIQEIVGRHLYNFIPSPELVPDK